MVTDASPSADDLMTLLDSEDLGDRLRAVNQARGLPHEVSYAILAKGAGDGNARVRYAALSQMGTLQLSDPQPAVELLRVALREDTEFDVRAAAAAGLGDLKQPQVLSDLLVAYERETEWLVQFSIIAALGELGNPEAFDTLVTAVHQGSDLIQTAAAAALGDLGDPKAIPILESLIPHEDNQLRYRVVLALQRIGGEATRAALTQLSTDLDPQVSRQATEALAQLESSTS